MNDHRRRVEWEGVREKAQWIDGWCYVDARLPLVRELATRFAQARDPNDHEGLIIDLQRFVRDSIKYVPDPMYEEIADAQTILERGFGDCDDKCRCFVALARAVSLDARIRPVVDRDGLFYHVQSEARWSGSDRHKFAQPNGWLLVELILRGCELGQSPNTIPTSSTGSRVLE